MACSGTRERDLARKYNLKCLRVNITRISKKQLDFYQINLEKYTDQDLKFAEVQLEPSESFCYPQNSETSEVKLEPSESFCYAQNSETSEIKLEPSESFCYAQNSETSEIKLKQSKSFCYLQNSETSEVKLEPSEGFSETAVKCLMKRETSDFSLNIHHDAAVDHLQDDLKNALTSELIIKSEECSSEEKELDDTDDSYIRQNLKAESVSPSQAKDGLQDELFIKSELECSEGEGTKEIASSEGENLCQDWRRTVHQTKVSAACYQQVCHQIKMKSKKNIYSKDTSAQKEMQSERDLTNVTSPSQIDSYKFDKDTEIYKIVQAASEIEQTKVHPYLCHVCDKTLSCKGSLLRHIKQVHEAVRSFHCNLCSQSSTSKKNLKVHLRVHSNERSFKCDKCCMFFKYKNELRNHNKCSHSDVRSFACQVCGKMFKSKGDIKCHMTVHAVDLNFKCGDCDKKFKSKQLLLRHKQSHSTLRPFGCDQCGKRFKRRSNISEHMAVHSDVRPFSCDFCAMSFKKKSDLRQHSVVYSSTFDFTCNLCTSKFKRKGDLLRHMKTLHSDARTVI